MASPHPPAAGPSTQPGQTVTPPVDSQPPPPTNPPTESNTKPAPTPAVSAPAQVPSTSLQDSGKSRRPRDARLIHMLLASHGVTAYQERVPLQLLDFAYRYTSSTLQDAVYLATEGYMGGEGGGGGGGKGQNANSQDLSTVGLPALRLSIASRLHYQFQPGLPKEFLMDMAAERNRVALPGVSRATDSAGPGSGSASSGVLFGGMRLPPERFCLTGTGWDLKSEWESEGEEEVDMEDAPGGGGVGGEGGRGGEEGEEEDEDEEGAGRMEDIFGEDAGEDEDKEMTDV
ncbi:Transcription initiation factor TFIID subunit 9 [Arachnomyces sp. PD_36]|nr:Transcription initiation factor TFIID subunit 9 [Arachnomyces sp. PD_36]